MSEWNRVTKRDPCKICGHDSWCTINEVLGIALCMRIQSDRPSKNSMGGWIHRIGDGTKPKSKVTMREPETPTIDATGIMRELWKNTTDKMRSDLAKHLGVSPIALHDLGASWFPQHHAWAWPMFNGIRQCVGIRLRNDAGKKWAVTGSRQGIFWPKHIINRTVYIVEGPTDCAAALTLDLFAIGRPCCQGCVPYIQVAINQLHAERAVLVADNDTPGINGAKSLADELQIPCAHMLLPTKDLRQFLLFGGTKMFIESQLESLVWQNPK